MRAHLMALGERSAGSITDSVTVYSRSCPLVCCCAQVARFENANGVILELGGIKVGVAVVLGSAGMTIDLQ
jgi:hypothetical protein